MSKRMRIKSYNSRGFALIIVLAAIALAAVLGYAMLSTASLSAQVDKNSSAINTSETLAESGIELAAYYLQHPELAPTLNTDGYWPGGTNVSLGGTLQIASITVTKTGAKTFKVVATASASSASTPRSVTATLYVDSKYVVKDAFAANGAVKLSGSKLNISSAVASTLASVRVDETLEVGQTVSGAILAAKSSDASGISAVPTYPSHAVPLANEVNLLLTLPSYKLNGVTYTANELTSDPGATLMTSNLATNPANVWYSKSSRDISGTTIINGTLVVMGSNSNLHVHGTLKVVPVTGMPAVVVQNKLELPTTSSALSVDGLVWVGKELNSAAGILNVLLGLLFEPQIDVRGAIMIANTSTVATGTGFRGSMKIVYTPDNLNVPEFSDVGTTPSSVKVLSWQ